MAYTRRHAPKVDIRSLNIKSLPEKEERHTTSLPASKIPAEIIIHHNPSLEIKRIVLCGIPLIAILFVASYLDTQKAWVVPFAEWLMRLGN